MFTAFFARVKPASTSANPACIQNTRIAATTVQRKFTGRPPPPVSTAAMSCCGAGAGGAALGGAAEASPASAVASATCPSAGAGAAESVRAVNSAVSATGRHRPSRGALAVGEITSVTSTSVDEARFAPVSPP